MPESLVLWISLDSCGRMS